MQLVRTVTKIEANPLLTSKKNEYKQLNVAAYCRVSTDSEDQLQSYDAQVKYYTEHICKNPKWHFVGIYADEGISGTLVNKRERFKDMIKDCEKGKIDLILTKSVSCFARNTVDSLNYVRRLKAMGIGVFFEEQNIDTLTTDSEMFIGLYSVMAQAESENISDNVKWGIRKRMSDGTFSFHFQTYGYRKGDDGQPEIVPEEANVIRKIFSMYLDGATVDTIIDYLQRNDIPNRKGETNWHRETIRLMLGNEKYVGDMLMQKTFRTDCISKKVKVNNGELPKYLISNNHPAIIDRETFKMVQQERSRRAGKRKTSDKTITELGKYSSKYALTELLVCGECGSPYRRRTINSHGEKKIYWRCLNRIEHGSKYCTKSIGIEEKKLQNTICRAISEVMPNREEMLKAIKATLEFAISGEKETLNKYNIELNIKQLQDEADMLMERAMKTEGDQERYFVEIEKLYAKIKALREQLELAQCYAPGTTSENAELKRISEIFENESFDFSEYDDLIIRRIVECIKVMHDRTIVIILKGGFEIREKLN